MASNLIVPPGGFAGFNNMTPASRAALSPMERAVRRSSRRQGVKIGSRRRKKSSGRKRTSSRKKSGGGRKMKFGSPAWQKKYKVGKYRK